MTTTKIEKAGISFAISRQGGPIVIEVRPHHDTISALRVAAWLRTTERDRRRAGQKNSGRAERKRNRRGRHSGIGSEERSRVGLSRLEDSSGEFQGGFALSPCFAVLDDGALLSRREH